MTPSIRAVGRGGVTMTVDVEAGLKAEVDARRIQQVLVNLVSNVVRYGGNAVLVTAHRERSALGLEVHDNGEDVPKKWELAIWNRFERGSQRFLASNPGTGIGLAAVADSLGPITASPSVPGRSGSAERSSASFCPIGCRFGGRECWFRLQPSNRSDSDLMPSGTWPTPDWRAWPTLSARPRCRVGSR